MHSYNDFSNKKDIESIIDTLKDERVIFEEPSYKDGTICINRDFNLFSNKPNSLKKLIQNDKLILKLNNINGHFLFDLRFTNYKIFSLENFPKIINDTCRLNLLQINRFSNIEEVKGDLVIDQLEYLRGLADAPKVKGDIRITGCHNIPYIEKLFYKDRKNQFPKEDYYKELLNWIIENKKFDGSIYTIVWPDKYRKILEDPNFKTSIQKIQKFNL